MTDTSYPQRMHRQRAAEYLQVEHGMRISPNRLAKLAVEGEGPRFYKDGRWPLYDRDDLNTWAEHRLGRSARSTAAHGSNHGRGGRPSTRETTGQLTCR
jgi:hypothetical protein